MTKNDKIKLRNEVIYTGRRMVTSVTNQAT